MAHAPAMRQAVQPCSFTEHSSIVVPMQRAAPSSHWGTHATHAPSRQALPLPQVFDVVHSPQPLLLAVQLSTVPPLQREAPRVHGLLQMPHRPLLQNSVQVAVGFQSVQPWPSTSHVSMPLPLQRETPGVQVRLQEPHEPLLQVVPEVQALCCQ